MLVIDSHLDLSYNALNWNRDLNQNVAEIRRGESGMAAKGRGTNTVAFPEMRRGEVGICLATVLARANPAGRTEIDFRNQEIACAMARGQLAYYQLLEQQGKCRMVRNLTDLRAIHGQWTSSRTDAPFGFILSMEGADPIVTPAQAREWWDDGLRVVGLAHYGPSAYAHGTASAGGLTPQGRELLRVMKDLGIVLDMTHLADQSFWEAIELFDGPILASHNNCRALVPGDRQFEDRQIRAIIDRGGVVGAAFDEWMLVPNWKPGMQPKVGLNAVIDHIDRVCQIAGSSAHAAIGSDLDGGYGTEQSPEGLDTIADLQKIPALLCARGYAEPEIAAIMHGNWMRLFESAWSAQD